MIEDCLLYLQHEQPAAKETIRTYRPSLRRFLEWVQANDHPAIGRTIALPRDYRVPDVLARLRQ